MEMRPGAAAGALGDSSADEGRVSETPSVCRLGVAREVAATWPLGRCGVKVGGEGSGQLWRIRRAPGPPHSCCVRLACEGPPACGHCSFADLGLCVGPEQRSGSVGAPWGAEGGAGLPAASLLQCSATSKFR